MGEVDLWYGSGTATIERGEQNEDMTLHGAQVIKKEQRRCRDWQGLDAVEEVNEMDGMAHIKTLVQNE